MSKGEERGRTAERARRGRGRCPASAAASTLLLLRSRPKAAGRGARPGKGSPEPGSLACLSNVGAKERSRASHPRVPPETPEGLGKREATIRRPDSEPGTRGKTFKGFEESLVLPLINCELW